MKKLASRKLWAALLGLLMGAGMVFGVDAEAVSTVSGAVLAVVSVVTYIATEGRIDAAGVADAASKVQDALDAVDAAAD